MRLVISGNSESLIACVVFPKVLSEFSNKRSLQKYEFLAFDSLLIMFPQWRIYELKDVFYPYLLSSPFDAVFCISQQVLKLFEMCDVKNTFRDIIQWDSPW